MGRSRTVLFFSVFALFAVLAFVARPQKSAPVSRFSDREIFEGAVFGVGPVASVLPEARDQLRPEIYAHSEDELAAMSSARDRLISSVEAAEPGFIAEFARVARSGDPAAIKSMLERAADVVDAVSGVVREDAPLYANVPNDGRIPPMRPTPGPKPTPPNVHPLYANVPNDGRIPPMRPTPGPRPAPTNFSMGLAMIDPASAQPAWGLFGSRLFSEQLAASMATKLDGPAPAGG
ncbi:MAG TPA: hypothetical protein VGG91_01045 [Myxococcaceae bacterium]